MGNLNFNGQESDFLELITEEMEGIISAENSIRLKEWRLKSPDNETYYLDVIKLNEELGLLEHYKNLKPHESLEVLHKKLNLDTNSTVGNSTKVVNFSMQGWLRIAASFIIVSAIAFYFISGNDKVLLKAGSVQSTYELPDGTKLVLNANSELSYSKSNFQKVRELELIKGECFIDVVHNPEKPFSIHYKDLEVTDIGTSFNVKLAQSQIDVVVSTGQVKLHIAGNASETILNAGDAAYYHISKKYIKKVKLQDSNYKAYTDHVINFNATALPEVVRTLESVYHRKIIIQSPNLNSRKFTGEFKKQKIKDVLKVIAETLQINIVTKNGVFYLVSAK